MNQRGIQSKISISRDNRHGLCNRSSQQKTVERVPVLFKKGNLSVSTDVAFLNRKQNKIIFLKLICNSLGVPMKVNKFTCCLLDGNFHQTDLRYENFVSRVGDNIIDGSFEFRTSKLKPYQNLGINQVLCYCYIYSLKSSNGSLKSSGIEPPKCFKPPGIRLENKGVASSSMNKITTLDFFTSGAGSANMKEPFS